MLCVAHFTFRGGSAYRESSDALDFPPLKSDGVLEEFSVILLHLRGALRGVG